MASDWDRMVRDMDRDRAKRAMTKQDVQRHLGRRLHSGGQAPPTSDGGGSSRPFRSRTVGLGFVGKRPAGFITHETQQSHKAVTLFMAGIGLIVILTAKASDGRTFIQVATDWIKKVTTGAPVTAAGVAGGGGSPAGGQPSGGKPGGGGTATGEAGSGSGTCPQPTGMNPADWAAWIACMAKSAASPPGSK